MKKGVGIKIDHQLVLPRARRRNHRRDERRDRARAEQRVEHRRRRDEGDERRSKRARRAAKVPTDTGGPSGHAGASTSGRPTPAELQVRPARRVRAARAAR